MESVSLQICPIIIILKTNMLVSLCQSVFITPWLKPSFAHKQLVSNNPPPSQRTTNHFHATPPLPLTITPLNLTSSHHACPCPISSSQSPSPLSPPPSRGAASGHSKA